MTSPVPARPHATVVFVSSRYLENSKRVARRTAVSGVDRSLCSRPADAAISTNSTVTARNHSNATIQPLKLTIIYNVPLVAEHSGVLSAYLWQWLSDSNTVILRVPRNLTTYREFWQPGGFCPTVSDFGGLLSGRALVRGAYARGFMSVSHLCYQTNICSCMWTVH